MQLKTKINKMNTTVTLEYDSKNDALKQVLQLFVTLGGNIINVENDDDLNDPEFLEKIKRGQEDYKNGNYKIIKNEDLWK